MCCFSTESGWDNPFRPGGDLSREADEIVELIKGGKPITPTPDSTAPPLPSLDEVDLEKKNSSTANNLGQQPITETPKKVNHASSHAAPNSVNGSVKNDSKAPTAPPGAVDVKRGTIKAEGGEVEHVTIKKKPKCKCCVIQ